MVLLKSLVSLGYSFILKYEQKILKFAYLLDYWLCVHECLLSSFQIEHGSVSLFVVCHFTEPSVTVFFVPSRSRGQVYFKIQRCANASI
jgi:hypothetical protein